MLIPHPRLAAGNAMDREECTAGWVLAGSDGGKRNSHLVVKKLCQWCQAHRCLTVRYPATATVCDPFQDRVSDRARVELELGLRSGQAPEGLLHMLMAHHGPSQPIKTSGCCIYERQRTVHSLLCALSLDALCTQCSVHSMLCALNALCTQ